MAMRIPPEIVDRIIDYVHDDVKTLTACSLIARDWVPSTRLHLFTRLSLLSAHEVARFTELDSFAPNVLYYCQELSIGTNNKFDYPPTPGFLPFVGTPPLTISERIDRFTSLHTLHFRGFPSGVENGLISPLVDISEKITTITFTDSSLESSYDLWKILRLFPNLERVHVSDLGYSSNREGRLIIAPSCCHSPPITSFSFHTYCQGFILEQLATPPYPLTRLKSLEIHHTDQQQQHLNSIATKYQDVITTLKFSAYSTLGSDIPPHIGMYNRLHTLIFGKLELFAAYPQSIRLHSPASLASFAWVTATIPYINSRLTRLVFEIAVTERRDLNAISWEDIDAFLDAREQFEGLKSVEVVFLDTMPTQTNRQPVRPGIDLKEDLMRRMRITVKKGLMKCSARGLRTWW